MVESFDMSLRHDGEIWVQDSFPLTNPELQGVASYNDDSPNTQSPLEWWFIQGYYEGPHSGRRHFMTSIFRHAVGSENAATNDGASMLLGVLDPMTSQHHTVSLVDKKLVDWTLTEGRSIFQTSNVDQAIVNAFVREVAANGPPRPIEVESRMPKFKGTPLRATWGDFELAQNADSFQLQFVEPGSQKVCRFELGPLPPRLDVMADRERQALGGMEYVTYPRVKVQGIVNNEPVKGEVWIDHQWGSLAWLLAPPHGTRVLGWDWFGINLEDGSDWIVMVHRDAESGEPVACHASRWDAKRHCRRASHLSLTPLRHWRSPRTKIKHPVAWRIEIPELAADLCFEPLADDQEFALFGTGRAIWEGAGTITGTVGDTEVSGRARGEFQGYGHIFDFESHLEDLATEIDADLESFLPREMNNATVEMFAGKPHWLHEPEALSATLTKPVWDLISRKGKRWRPAFGLLMLEVLGEDSESYRTMMCILAELAHTGSLIIDDIEDNSKVRRGGPTIHEIYGVDVALNAANTLYFLPSLLVQNHPLLSDKQRMEIYEIINRVYIRAHCGQGMDIYWSSHMSQSKLESWLDASLAPKILQGYGYKTAAPIAGFAEIAAVIAGVDPAVRAAAADLGRIFGVAFQVLDDVRNFSTSPHWTKVAGEDLTAGKLTYVIVRTLDLLDSNGRRKLIDLLCNPELRQSADAIREGLELVHASGSLRMCKDEARHWVHEAWSAFSVLVPSSESKMLLELLCERMLELPYDP